MKIEITNRSKSEYFVKIAERICALDDVRQVPSVGVGMHGHFAMIFGLYVPASMRREGLAAALVQGALDLAIGWRGIPIHLDAIPFADEPMTQEQLFAWYARFGFRRCIDSQMDEFHPYSMVLNRRLQMLRLERRELSLDQPISGVQSPYENN